MDERDRQQLILTLEHDADLRMRSFQKDLDVHYGQCALKGMFGSGFRIRRALELIGETVSNFTNHAIDTAQSISKDYESFALVKGNCETMFSTLAARLPSIVWHPDGVPKPNDQSTYDAAKGRMDQIALDLGAALKIAEFRFGRNEQTAEFPLSALEATTRPQTDDARIKAIPVWLNMAQATAWVRYRTNDAVTDLRDATLLSAEHRYGSRELHEVSAGLKMALEAGQVTAHGTKSANADFVEIPAVAWSVLPIAPLDSARTHPYCHIVVKFSELASVFPPSGQCLDRRMDEKRPRLPDGLLIAWQIALGDDRALPQEELIKAVRATYPDYTISRQRIRDLDPGRKRGKKPLRHKATAQLPPK